MVDQLEAVPHWPLSSCYLFSIVGFSGAVEPAGAVVAVTCYSRTGWALVGLVADCFGLLIGIDSEAGTIDFARY